MSKKNHGKAAQAVVEAEQAEQGQPEEPVEQAVVETPVRAPKTKTPKRLTEAELIERYPHVQPGSMRWETEGKHANKQTVEAELACGHIARVATSDLFQVKQCPACKKPAKKAASPKGEVAPVDSSQNAEPAPELHRPSNELIALARSAQ